MSAAKRNRKEAITTNPDNPLAKHPYVARSARQSSDDSFRPFVAPNGHEEGVPVSDSRVARAYGRAAKQGNFFLLNPLTRGTLVSPPKG